jgi:hypothetical protein
MATRLKGHSSLTLYEILKAVKSLTPDDQARLRDELAALTQVYITKPDPTKGANQRGRELADQLRDELHSSAAVDELDQVMSRLRDRTWSS